MKRLVALAVAGVVGAGILAPLEAEAGDHRRQRAAVRVYSGPFFPSHDVYVIREYYRPSYRPLPPGLARKYYRTGWLPPGWQRRIRPIPFWVERQLVPLPPGYYRGFIDNHAVVYDARGTVIDVTLIF